MTILKLKIRKKSLFNLFTILFFLSVSCAVQAQFSYDTSIADVSIGAPSTDADWNKTYNEGSASAVKFTPTEAEVSGRNSCNNKANGKQDVLALSSSDSQWLDIEIPSGSNSTILAIMFNVVGNSSGSWTEYLWYSTSSPFDANKAYRFEYTLPGYDKACVDQKFQFPDDVKSVRMYRRVKTKDNGDGTYSLACGDCKTNAGSGQTHGIFSMYVWLNKGPQILNFSIKGAEGIINDGAGTIEVTLPYAEYQKGVTSLTPDYELSLGATVVGTIPTDYTTPQTINLKDGEGNTKSYTVTVKSAPCATENKVLSYQYDKDGEMTSATIAGNDITLTMPYSYSPGKANEGKLSSITTNFTISNLATSSIESGIAVDYKTTNTLVVTSECGVANTYNLKLDYDAAATGNNVETFSLTNAGSEILQVVDIDNAQSKIKIKVAQSATFDNANVTVSKLATYALDLPNNKITVTSEAGVAHEYVLEIERDGEAPKMEIKTPVKDATGVSLAGIIRLEFNEPVILGTGNCAISDGVNTVTPAVKTAIGPNGMTIVEMTFSGLQGLTKYNLTFDAGYFTDLFGNPVAAVTDHSFTTADGTLHAETLADGYASYMDGDAFEQPAFIIGNYDATVDSKASTSTQYGAYVLNAGESLIVNLDAGIAGEIGVHYYSLAQSASIDVNGISGTMSNYENKGAYIVSAIDPAQTSITVTNTGSTEIYVPYIYISKAGDVAKTEKDQWCGTK